MVKVKVLKVDNLSVEEYKRVLSYLKRIDDERNYISRSECYNKVEQVLMQTYPDIEFGDDFVKVLCDKIGNVRSDKYEKSIILRGKFRAKLKRSGLGVILEDVRVKLRVDNGKFSVELNGGV